ncbi:unannotated protein [freshwater metagenome]|uniref:Unannotated protein n=1 Tax=freshwater metagenome TaxID=449393 RepID=A0A6J6G610_9ZZZZ
MAVVVRTTTMVERIIGTVMRMKRRQLLAPSNIAASTISSGTFFIAADNTTIANPV